MLPPSEEKQAESGSPDALSALRRFTRARAAIERCELCGTPLAEEHPHLLERLTSQVACSCPACAILFCDQQSGRYLRIPRRVALLENFAIDDLAWEQMALPINLAFFIKDESGRLIARYPSPAGAVESLVSTDGWDEGLSAHPVTRTMEAETEALLVHRLGPEPICLVVPIDECYRLVGMIRRSWRGLSGGAEVWLVVARLFAELQQRAAGTAQVRRA